MAELRRPRMGWLRRTWSRHPRMAMAVRAALAAAIAWFVARNLPDPAGDYPYYAPMGAVIATSTTLASSVREALRSVAAITLGGIVATLAHFLGNESNPLVLAAAVAAAVMVGG
ncbi:FUSC family protein, partial [Georgenia sp. 10Sc9-8]|nr:FUSC family protein [Georgenia halotolerans]